MNKKENMASGDMQRMHENKIACCAEIHAFAEKWLRVFRAGNVQVAEEQLGEECDAMGFFMDCGKAMEHFQKGSMSDNEVLKSCVEPIDNVLLLGSGIYSQWRYYQHWANSPWNIEWFLIAFQRLAELTSKTQEETMREKLAEVPGVLPITVEQCKTCVWSRGSTPYDDAPEKKYCLVYRKKDIIGKPDDVYHGGAECEYHTTDAEKKAADERIKERLSKA